MNKRIFIIFLSLFFNILRSYCGCCPCCVDPKLEIQRQFENIKLEDKDILNLDDGYEADDYSQISDINSVGLINKDPSVDSNLNFNSLIKAKKYFKIFYDVYFSSIKEANFEDIFKEGYEELINKLVKDIDDKADFYYLENNDKLVCETSFKFSKSKFKDVSEVFLNNSVSQNKKIYHIIEDAIIKKKDFKLYFETKLIEDNTDIKLRKEASDKFEIIYKSNAPLDDAQKINYFNKLDDTYFKKTEFIFIFYLKSMQFYILAEKEKFKNVEEKYNDLNS